MYVNREMLAEIREAIGEDALDELLSLKGGARFSVPARVSDTHWLVDTIGLEAAQKLIGFLGGRGSLHLELPAVSHARKRAEIRRLLKDGLSSDEVARQTGVARRTVQRHLAKIQTGAP